MKKLLSFLLMIIVAITLSFCSGGDSKTTVVTQPGTVIPEDPEDPEDPEITYIATVQTTTGVKFFDGNLLYPWKSGTIKKATNKIYSSDDVLYALNDNGTTADSITLPAIPNIVKVILPAPMKSMTKAMSEPISLDEAETWVIETIPAEEAYAMGALYKDYTRLWQNGVEYGHWYEKDYACDNFITIGSDIFAKKSTGTWTAIAGGKTDINFVNDEFVIHNFNASGHTATINDVNVSWTYNFFNTSNKWMKSGSKWYSHNGYTWDGATLVENGSVLWDFRSIQNRMLQVGKHYENGEDVLYYIKCDTGHIIRFVPSLNGYTEYKRIYNGDGTLDTALAYIGTLNPAIVADYFYFVIGDTMYRFSFQDGITNAFSNDILSIEEF